MNEMMRTPLREDLFIGGNPVPSPQLLEIRNPAHPSELVGTIVRGTPEHVDQAIQIAKQAQVSWARKSFSERAAVLRSAIHALTADIEERSRLFVRENGKTLVQARGELTSVSKRQMMALDYASTLDELRTYEATNGESYVLKRPYGVVVSIVPWNSPDVLAFTQIVAALFAGNSVVLKPPESCALTLIDSVRRFSQHIPAGLLNVVTGLPAEIGDALTTHPDVGKIAFTGSIPSARTIMGNASRNVTSVTLELGGNDPAIILPDFVITPEALGRMVLATFMMTGQVCMAIKRIFVPRSLEAHFVESFCSAVDRLVIGDGLLPQVTLGPLHTAAGLARAKSILDDARASGAEIRTLGRVDDETTFASGHFMMPTVAMHINDSARLVHEEQFCPVVPVSIYDDVEEAVQRANSSHFGLAGSVWGSDRDRAIDVAKNIEAGQVWVNTHGVLAINPLAPYGGMKQSGLGRKSGIEGVLEYLQSQTITTFEG